MEMVNENSKISGQKFDPSVLNQRSFQLGMIYALSEAVGSGVKRLALSPPLSKEELNHIYDDVNLIANEFNLKIYLDDDFLTTKLFNPEYTKNKLVIHIAAKAETIYHYKALREKKKIHIKNNTLIEEIERELAWSFGSLLSYSDETIERLLKNPRF
jgi:hypothetical protein